MVLDRRTMRLLALGCLLIAFCASRSASQPLQDPGGWTQAKWGMTVAELKQAFPQAVFYSTRQSGSTFGIPEYDLDGAKVHVSFDVDEKAGLHRVLIEPVEKSSVDPALDSPPPTVARIGEILLLASLKDRYSQPIDRTVEPSWDGTGLVTHQWRWSFPATSVVLVWKSHAIPANQQLDRTYVMYDRMP
jgi:hypothetical protein